MGGVILASEGAKDKGTVGPSCRRTSLLTWQRSHWHPAAMEQHAEDAVRLDNAVLVDVDVEMVLDRPGFHAIKIYRVFGLVKI